MKKKAEKKQLDFTPLFPKETYTKWLLEAKRRYGYAAPGQVERWAECVKQWRRIEKGTSSNKQDDDITMSYWLDEVLGNDKTKTT